jgi:hypothetical protein
MTDPAVAAEIALQLQMRFPAPPSARIGTMSLPCPSSLNSQILTCFALLLIPPPLEVVVAATKVPPIPEHGRGEPRPPAASVGHASAGIGARARSNYEPMSNRAKLKLILESLLPNALKHSPGAGPFSSRAQ